jgi:adenosylmethionine-8-amino-7-oxononanoate aminotransferase
MVKFPHAVNPERALMSIDETVRRLTEADRNHLWHPFTQMREWAREDPLIVTEGRGVYLKDIRGRWFIDGVSSLWVNLHGHRRPELDEALAAQVGRISHSTLLGAASVPAIELASRLSALMDRSFGPGRLARVFYSDNGSTAVEVALKMAFQYWKLRGAEGRHSFVSLQNGYHGDTIGAMSVGGVDLFHGAFGPLFFKTHRAPSPYCYRCPLARERESCGLACLGAMEDILREHHASVAAVILEPRIQCAGGMIAAPPGYLRGVRELADRYGVLLIADEVATGFGRTGRMFACEHEGVAPDIICLSKGLTGGYMPLAATIATEEIYSAFLGEFSELKTFFHGHSYTGNQLGCAVALAGLDIFEREDVLARLAPRIAQLADWLARIAAHPHVGDVRQAGLVAGVELVRERATKEPYAWEEKRGWRVAHEARERGVLIRPLGNTVVIMPPLSIAEDELGALLAAIEGGIGAATG